MEKQRLFSFEITQSNLDCSKLWKVLKQKLHSNYFYESKGESSNMAANGTHFHIIPNDWPVCSAHLPDWGKLLAVQLHFMQQLQLSTCQNILAHISPGLSCCPGHWGSAVSYFQLQPLCGSPEAVLHEPEEAGCAEPDLCRKQGWSGWALQVSSLHRYFT